MRYSIEPRDRIYVKGYGFLSFTKNMGRYANKVTKSLSNKYGQKHLDNTKKCTTDAIKTHKKRYISPEERQQIINELRLIPKKDPYF